MGHYGYPLFRLTLLTDRGVYIDFIHLGDSAMGKNGVGSDLDAAIDLPYILSSIVAQAH